MLGLAAPVVLLVGVVAAGALGPAPIPEQPPAPASPAPLTAERGQGRPAPNGPFPLTWIGLRVRGVADTQAARAAGDARGVVAVAGYLDYGSLSWTCVDAYLDVDRAACDGLAVLRDTPSASTDAGTTGAGPAGSPATGGGPHLHPLFPAGARGPAPDDVPGSPRSQPIPVVMLGSFDDARIGPCDPATTRCDERFIVERVVWVAGAPWGPTLTIDPAMGVDPNIPEIRASVADAVAALGRGSLPLATAVVRPGVLKVIDPAAAAALPAIPDIERLRPVTYVRGLVFQFDASQPLYGRDPAIGWVVLNSITGDVLARGGQAAKQAGGGVPAP